MSNEQTVRALLAARTAIDEALAALNESGIRSAPLGSAENADLIHGVAAIGAFLGLSKRQAQYWIDTTDIPVIRNGKRGICARRGDLSAWLARRAS